VTNFSLVERAKGHGPAISHDELLDLLTELDDWRAAADTCGIDCPQALQPAIESLQAELEQALRELDECS